MTFALYARHQKYYKSFRRSRPASTLDTPVSGELPWYLNVKDDDGAGRAEQHDVVNMVTNKSTSRHSFFFSLNKTRMGGRVEAESSVVLWE